MPTYSAEEIAKIAKDNKITNKDEVDAFRHMYAAATSTNFVGGLLTRFGGELVEMGGMIRFYVKSLLGLTKDTWVDADNERYKDFYNNELGIKIGQSSASEKEIVERIKAAIIAGEAVINPSDARTRFEKDFPETDDFILKDTGDWRLGTGAPMSIREGEWDWMDRQGGIGSTGSINVSQLIQQLGSGRKGGGMSTSQILLTSAAALARELTKSRRMSLEDDLMDIFGGGNRKGGGILPSVSSGQNGGMGNMLFDAVERMVGGALSRSKTRVSSAETDRSLEAQQKWNPSMGQQQALLAQWAQSGTKNL